MCKSRNEPYDEEEKMMMKFGNKNAETHALYLENLEKFNIFIKVIYIF